MADRDRNDRGRFTKEHSDAEIIGAVRSNEPASSREVADALGVERESAYRRLRQLESAGRVTSKDIGGSLAWSVAERD